MFGLSNQSKYEQTEYAPLRVARALLEGKEDDVRKYLGESNVKTWINTNVTQIYEKPATMFGTVLGVACQWSTAANVKELLSERIGADWMKPDSNGDLPLHDACKSTIDSEEKVKLLLEADKDKQSLQSTNKHGNTPIHIAAKNGKTAIVERLVASASNIREIVSQTGQRKRQALHFAAGCGEISTVQALLSHQASVDCKDDEQHTPLTIASFYGKTKVVELLLKHNALINAQTQHGRTGLHEAVSQGHVHTVEKLLQLQADTRITDADGDTALSFAAYFERPEMIDMLIEHGGKDDVNSRNRNYSTPLHVASSRGHGAVIEKLLKHGADIEASDRDDDTPLIVACENNQIHAVKVLLDHSASVRATDRFKRTALHGAAWQGNVECVELLLEAGSRVDATDDDRCSALHLAVAGNHLEVVQLLIAKHANVQLKDGGKNSVIDIAIDVMNEDDVTEADEDDVSQDGDDVSMLEYLLNSGKFPASSLPPLSKFEINSYVHMLVVKKVLEETTPEVIYGCVQRLLTKIRDQIDPTQCGKHLFDQKILSHVELSKAVNVRMIF